VDECEVLWDGGTLPNRGPCAALELDMEYGGVSEFKLVTHIDLSVYAEMMVAGRALHSSTFQINLSTFFWDELVGFSGKNAQNGSN